jgi:hypothetical protein
MGRRTLAKIAADDAALVREVADLLADVPALPECPLHGADCEAWA